MVGLLIGPLFVVAEIGFALGLRDDVREEIERRVGPTTAPAESAASAAGEPEPVAHSAPASVSWRRGPTARSRRQAPLAAPSRP